MTERKGNRPMAKSADGFFGLSLTGWLGSGGRAKSDAKSGKGLEGRAVFIGADKESSRFLNFFETFFAANCGSLGGFEGMSTSSASW